MVQKHYQGFLNTPYLWENKALLGLTQFELNPKSTKFRSNINHTLRLGKYVERFVSYELEQQNDISVLAENIQIQQEKQTIGELDCLLLINNQPIHLEIIYKFYVYDESVGHTEIEHFIGPNRKDSLIEKLLKLKEKQLPLLHSKSCKPYLEKFEIEAKNIKQYVYFKAQLFVPFSNPKIQLQALNQNCIMGYYISRNELKNFADCKFYVPSKKDWLIIPSPNVNWIAHKSFKAIAEDYFERQFSPMCWIKSKTGEIKKIFLVWWSI